MLSWLGLGFSRGLEVRHECEVDEHHVFFANVQRDLADGFQKRQPFNIADCASEFCDNNVHIGSPQCQDRRFNLVGDMRHDLNSSSEVLPTTFFFNNRQINLTSRVVGIAVENSGGESFIMAKIEVCLGTIVQNIDLTVLKWAHGSRINIEIRVKLLHADFQTATLKQHANRR